MMIKKLLKKIFKSKPKKDILESINDLPELNIEKLHQNVDSSRPKPPSKNE